MHVGADVAQMVIVWKMEIRPSLMKQQVQEYMWLLHILEFLCKYEIMSMAKCWLSSKKAVPFPK